jgi:hypothetical protein
VSYSCSGQFPAPVAQTGSGRAAGTRWRLPIVVLIVQVEIMSQQLQTRNYWMSTPPPPDPTQEALRYELGWREVAEALGQILWGYAILAFSILVGVAGVAMLYLSFVTRRGVPRGAAPPSDISVLWVVLLGGAILVLLIILAYWKILVGKVRCAISSPERCGARWFIFSCALCIVIGPVLGIVNTVAQVTAVTDAIKDKQKAQGGRFQGFNAHEEQKLVDSVVAKINFGHAAGTLVSVFVTVFFIMFLRATGKCFKSWILVWGSNLHLLLSVAIIGLTVASFSSTRVGHIQMGLLAALVLCGLASTIGYILLVIYARVLIIWGMGRVRSPLEAR